MDNYDFSSFASTARCSFNLKNSIEQGIFFFTPFTSKGNFVPVSIGQINPTPVFRALRKETVILLLYHVTESLLFKMWEQDLQTTTLLTSTKKNGKYCGCSIKTVGNTAETITYSVSGVFE